MRHRTVRTAVATLLATAAFGCHSGRATIDTGASGAVGASSQQFTRSLPVMAPRVVQAAVQVFAENHIPVATADEASGFVQSVPVELGGDWGNLPVQDRVNCPSNAVAAGQRIQFAVQVTPTANGSTVSLQSLPMTQKKGDAAATCVLRAEFMSRLLDDIAQRAGA